MYILTTKYDQSIFRECAFTENVAEDGGAAYLNTASGVDVFMASAFRNNYAGESKL